MIKIRAQESSGLGDGSDRLEYQKPALALFFANLEMKWQAVLVTPSEFVKITKLLVGS